MFGDSLYFNVNLYLLLSKTLMSKSLLPMLMRKDCSVCVSIPNNIELKTGCVTAPYRYINHSKTF